MKSGKIEFKAEQLKIKVPKVKRGNHKNYYRDRMREIRKSLPTL